MKAAPRYLGVQELADSSVVLRFVVDVDEKDIYTGARVLNHDLLLGFRKLSVEVPSRRWMCISTTRTDMPIPSSFNT